MPHHALRAFPDGCFSSSENAGAILGSWEAWYDGRRELWVIRTGHPRSRTWRQIYIRKFRYRRLMRTLWEEQRRRDKRQS